MRRDQYAYPPGATPRMSGRTWRKPRSGPSLRASQVARRPTMSIRSVPTAFTYLLRFHHLQTLALQVRTFGRSTSGCTGREKRRLNSGFIHANGLDVPRLQVRPPRRRYPVCVHASNPRAAPIVTEDRCAARSRGLARLSWFRHGDSRSAWRGESHAPRRASDLRAERDGHADVVLRRGLVMVKGWWRS
jgi:hypothetical protein